MIIIWSVRSPIYLHLRDKSDMEQAKGRVIDICLQLNKTFDLKMLDAGKIEPRAIATHIDYNYGDWVINAFV